MINLNTADIKAQHARLMAALLACDNPGSTRANELRGMVRELEKDMRLLEQARVLEMAARLRELTDG